LQKGREKKNELLRKNARCRRGKREVTRGWHKNGFGTRNSGKQEHEGKSKGKKEKDAGKNGLRAIGIGVDLFEGSEGIDPKKP